MTLCVYDPGWQEDWDLLETLTSPKTREETLSEQSLGELCIWSILSYYTKPTYTNILYLFLLELLELHNYTVAYKCLEFAL